MSLHAVPSECFCVNENGDELEGTRTSPTEADYLDCTHASWYTEYLVWRRAQFTGWFQTFNAFMKKKNVDVTKQPKACPASVDEDMCDESKRVCYDDYFGCRYCHCSLDIKALIPGTCSTAKQDEPVECLTKGGDPIDSTKKCLARGCCFRFDTETGEISCFEQFDIPMDELVAMNWNADHKYIDYLLRRYNRWVAGQGPAKI